MRALREVLRLSRVLLVLPLLLGAGVALAQPNPADIVGGTTAATASPADPPVVTTLYVVPGSSYLVLTDFEYTVDLHISEFGTELEIPVVILEGASERWGSVLYMFTNVNMGTSGRNPITRSFTTGIVFGPGSQVNVSHHPGSDLTSFATADWRISWGGYLAPTTLTEVGGLFEQGATEGLTLSQGAPNPFGSRTEIRFTLPNSGRVALRVVDVRGRLVRTLTDEFLGAGEHTVTWDARNESGRAVPSGVYFVDLAMGSERAARKTVVLQ